MSLLRLRIHGGGDRIELGFVECGGLLERGALVEVER